MFHIFSQIRHRVKLGFLLSLFSSAFTSVPLVMDTPSEPIIAFHESPYFLGWDIDFSPYSGGADLLFVHRSLERLEEITVARAPLYYSKIAAARFWRISDLFLVWLAANYFTVVVQHEVFGHGYRIRDLGKNKAFVANYSFGTPPPYGGGGGETSLYLTDQITTTELSSISIGGIESTAILAQLTKLGWLMAGKIDPRQSLLYLFAEQDITLYVGSLDPKGEELAGHDISEYLETLQWTYPKGHLSKATLKLLSIVSWIDPFTFYSAYAWLHYFWSGKEGHIPMIKIGSYGYLPALRMGLAPFGPEFFLENYLTKKQNPIYFYGKGGSYGGNNYLGIGCFAPKIWQIGIWSIGARFDGWWQPKLLLDPLPNSTFSINFKSAPDPNNPLYPYSEQHNMKLGGAATILVSVEAYKRLGFQLEGGYKTQGFLPGNSLLQAPIVRCFLSLVF